MIRPSLKHVVAVAVLAGVSAGANANTTDLGTISFGAPMNFTGTVLGSQKSFSDIINFSLAEPNGSSGYSVVNFPVNIPDVGSLGVVLATLSLVSDGPDGKQGTADDVVLKSVVLPSAGNSSDHLSLIWDQPLTGPAYLNITGVTSGTLGGLYSGSISVSPVPEPETYAMLLAGLGLMGAVVRRRSLRGDS